MPYIYETNTHAIPKRSCCGPLQNFLSWASFKVTKYHKLGVLKTTEIYSFIVLQTRSLKLRCQLGHIPSGTLWNPPLPLSSFWWWPSILSIPWLVTA